MNIPDASALAYKVAKAYNVPVNTIMGLPDEEWIRLRDLILAQDVRDDMRAGDIDLKNSAELYGRSAIEVMRQVVVDEKAQREYTTSLMGRFKSPPGWNSYGLQRDYLAGFGMPEKLVGKYLDDLYTGRETPSESRFVKAISKYTSIPVVQVMSMSQDQWALGLKNIKDLMKASGLLREAMPVDNLGLAYETFWQQAMAGQIILNQAARPPLVERVRQMLLDSGDTEKRFIEAVQMVNRELPLNLDESFEYVKNILQASIRYKTANEAADVVRALDSAKRATSRPQDQPSWRPLANPVSMRDYDGVRIIEWEEKGEVRQPEPDSILVNRRKFRFEEGQA